MTPIGCLTHQLYHRPTATLVRTRVGISLSRKEEHSKVNSMQTHSAPAFMVYKGRVELPPGSLNNPMEKPDTPTEALSNNKLHVFGPRKVHGTKGGSNYRQGHATTTGNARHSHGSLVK